jgi:hypothetical protein
MDSTFEHLQQFLSRKRRILLYGAFPILAFLTFVRRKDALLSPQFWAEDGLIFYLQAFETGQLKTIFAPYAGYLHLLPRLVAGVSTHLPLAYAPLLFNSVALLIQVLPLGYILSDRFDSITIDLRLKLLLASLYVLVPPCFEIHVVLANSQWHLAPLVCLILMSKAPRSYAGKLLDYLIIAVSSLTGPFTAFLVPAMYLLAYKRRVRHFYIISAIATAGALFQTFTYIGGYNTRPLQNAPLSLKLLTMIVGKIFLSALAGMNGYIYLTDKVGFPMYVLAIVLYLPLTIYIYSKLPRVLLLLPYLSIVILVLAVVTSPSPHNFVPADNTSRYFHLPMLTFLFGMAFFLFMNRGAKIVKAISILSLFILFTIGVPLDFFYHPFRNYHFRQQARLFTNLLDGTGTVFTINPDWRIKLFKPGVLVDTRSLTPIEDSTLTFIHDVSGQAVFEGETVSIPVQTNRPITMNGWAVDKQAQRAGAGVIIDVDNGRYNIPALYGLPREDVAYQYRDARYRFSGFEAELPAYALSKGLHTLFVKVVAADGQHYYAAGHKVTLNIQ